MLEDLTGIGGGEGLDGVLVDLQDEVVEDGHLCPSPVQQLGRAYLTLRERKGSEVSWRVKHVCLMQ